MIDVRHELQEVFRANFNDPSIVLRDEMSAKDFEDWDSMQHINLVIATEKRLKVRFTTSEIARLKNAGQNIGSFIALLEQKVGAGGA
jgi:acyl carrier protein